MSRTRSITKKPSPGPRQADGAAVVPTHSTGIASDCRPDDAACLAGLEDRTLVLLPASPLAETLVRRVRPLTHRVRGPFWCLHVTTPGTEGGESDELALRSACMLARSLGGEVIEAQGDSVEEVALRVAREKQATQILIGMSRTQRLWPFGGATLSARLAKAYGEAHVMIVAEPLRD
jgi:K+-sensing histidine kinase KdpD